MNLLNYARTMIRNASAVEYNSHATENEVVVYVDGIGTPVYSLADVNRLAERLARIVADEADAKD